MCFDRNNFCIDSIFSSYAENSELHLPVSNKLSNMVLKINQEFQI